MEPGERSGIPECKDIFVAAEGVAAEGHHGSCHVSQNVVDVVVADQPEDPPDSFENPNQPMEVLPLLMTMNQSLPPQLVAIQNLRSARRN